MSAVILANCYPTTWLAIGMIFFFTSFFNAPQPIVKLATYSVWVAIAYVTARVFDGLAIYSGLKTNYYLPSPEHMGRTTTVLYDKYGDIPDKPSGRGVVCFIVGSQQNHPFGILAPGVFALGRIFDSMWATLEQDVDIRNKYGFLGRTAVMVNQSLNRGNKLFYLSYWRSMEDLHAFNQSKYHAEGLKWWAENHKRCPHIGIFHETFEAPPHHWETIYENMHPFGMGETEVVTDPLQVDKLMNPLVKAEGGSSGMIGRLGSDAKSPFVEY